MVEVFEMKDFPKTRRELFEKMEFPGKYEDEQENFNKAVSELMKEGLVEYVEGVGYYLTNPRGVKAAKKVIKDGSRK